MVTLDEDTLVIDISQVVEDEEIVPGMRWAEQRIPRMWVDLMGPAVHGVLLDWFDFTDRGIGRIRYISRTGVATIGYGHVKMRPDDRKIFRILFRGLPPSSLWEDQDPTVREMP